MREDDHPSWRPRESSWLALKQRKPEHRNRVSCKTLELKDLPDDVGELHRIVGDLLFENDLQRAMLDAARSSSGNLLA